MTPREIDALVAEHVFGEPKPTEPADFDLAPIGIWRAIDTYGEPECRWDAPGYSTDPAAGDQLLDKMQADGWAWSLEWVPSGCQAGMRACVFKVGQEDDLVYVDADTKWMAVSLAALKARGVEVSR